MADHPPTLDAVRYEVLPFRRVEAEVEADAASVPLTLTVTCSPKHGVDAALDAADTLRGFGHAVVLHLAARMVRSPGHLDEVLARMAELGILDVFLVGGDAERPLGPYASGVELLPDLCAHRLAPRTVGVPGYPEGHPLIGDDALAAALREKAPLADYLVSQLCFDPAAVLRWVDRTREGGVELPLYVGVPGAVDRRTLLNVSRRVGVGASLSFLRKQRGLKGLMARPEAVSRRMIAAAVPLIGADRGVAGLHVYTFDRLTASRRLVARHGISTTRPSRPGGATTTTDRPPSGGRTIDKEHEIA